MRRFLFSTFVFLLILPSLVLAKSESKSIVQFHETYELANIILALTEYGKADKYEINKTTSYYQEVFDYFEPVSDHPLLGKVNYSREKWDKFLSFRTDAVAFTFDKNGKLIRKHKFYAMGKDINEFDSHLKLIDDFVTKSNYRTFYRSKRAYYDSLTSLYEHSLMLPEIDSFLRREFRKKSKSNHCIIISPLVGRMHCQRYFNNASTSFINVPDYLYGISSINEANKKEIASGLHMFFTEVDHDYVNPTTRKFKKAYQLNFSPAKWDKESGYAKWEYAVFNEYMTWAVYDLFIKAHFPEVADTVISEWHEVNISRGFHASDHFGAKLLELYSNREEGTTIRDLYPKILAWCKESEDS